MTLIGKQNSIMHHACLWNMLRLASRALMLLILATVRGVYCCLEQPSSSTMRFFPDLLQVGELIKERLAGEWHEQTLSEA